MTAIRGLVGRLLFDPILYYGRARYLIGREGRIEDAGEEVHGKARTVVLGKQHYFEISKTFPISGIKDISSAVRMDISSMAPFKTERFLVRKVEEADGKATLNIWFLDPEICHTLDELSPRLVLPESALLSFLNENVGKIYAIDKGVEHLLIYAGPDGLVKSMAGRDGDKDLLSFRRTIGAEATNCTVTVVKGMDEYLSLLRSILDTLPLKKMLPFVNRNIFLLSGSGRNLKWSLATAAALIFLFISLSFLFPYLAVNRLASEDKALSRNLREVLKTREDVEYYLNREAGLAKRINQYPYKIELIEDLNLLLPEKTLLKQLTVSGNMVEIRGATPKGSALLSALGRGEKIKNVKFTSRVRKDPKTGMELFSISFAYERQRDTQVVTGK